jgi:hypothetical protein
VTAIEAFMALTSEEQEIVCQSIKEGLTFAQALQAMYELKKTLGDKNPLAK